MFGITREELIRNLEKIRAQRCAYSVPEDATWHCDCKFGQQDQGPSILSETFSGCPEIMQAIEIFKAMDDTAFRMYCIEAGVTLTFLTPKPENNDK